ncbi:MAG TPA: efflux RND transporter periplasmic adaptor subunit [Kofleriaceae bacterium]|nr:efflux RND transporter periplasmic adaptor subunit [Kofleriaceae bacterium]
MDRTNSRLQPVSGEAMDRVLPRRRRWLRGAPVAAVAVAGAVAAYLALRPDPARTLAVDTTRIEISPVVRGRFDDYVQVRARATPARTTFIDTAQGGQVEAIHVEDGAKVEAGQLLVDLSNTALQLDVISREAQITEQLNALRGLELAHEQNRLAHKREVVEVDYQISRLTRRTAREDLLAEGGVVSRGEQEDLVEELAYYKRRRAVQLESFAAADRLQRAQLVQLRAASIQLERNIEIARHNMDTLHVRAQIAGQLTAFTLEVGQSLAAGERIAQIDDPSRFKLTAEIDEFYLGRVDAGQRADYELDGHTYQLRVGRIRPQVQNGRFEADLQFDGTAPTDVHRGQTAQLRLQLGQPTDAILVPNAAFYHDTGGSWVFVVSSDHRRAVRRTVRLGRRNPQFIEVLDGLRAGEEIVTSAYTNYLDTDRLEVGP